MKVFSNLKQLKDSVGEELGVSDWLEVTQARIRTFANATDDHQWIHVDPARAVDGPYGTTIARGYLTVSLLAPLMKGTYRVDGAKMAVNYGLNKVRFPAPLPSGSRLRVRVVLTAAEEVSGGVQAVFKATLEVEGSEKPACVAEPVVRIYFWVRLARILLKFAHLRTGSAGFEIVSQAQVDSLNQEACSPFLAEHSQLLFPARCLRTCSRLGRGRPSCRMW